MATTEPRPKTFEITRRSICPACDGAQLEVIYAVRDIPAHSCILLTSREEALEFPTRDLELAFCSECGLVFNRLFDESVIAYSTNFEESQHFSNTFNSFAKCLAVEIAEECQSAGKHVLEIGCGKGEFLLELCSVGGCSGIGIDPGFRTDRIAGKQLSNVRFIADFFGPNYEDLPADIVLCRHTLEHIPNVSQFVTSVYKLVEMQRNRIAVFETPDVERVLREGAFWDIYYEHCSYFSAGTHARLFRRCGFDVTKLNLVYDQQYIVQFARGSHTTTVHSRTAGRSPLENDLEELRDLATTFSHRVESIQTRWKEMVLQRAKRGERTILWGGGSKGVSFLTTLGLDDEIDCVVDVNPYKQGKYMPATGHSVVAPESLRQRPPSLVIVMNSIYLDEIRAQLNRLGLSPEVIAV